MATKKYSVKGKALWSKVFDSNKELKDWQGNPHDFGGLFKIDVILDKENKAIYDKFDNNDSNAKIIESTTKNDLEYTFYSYNDSEWNYVIKISDSSTGLLIGNPISEESARECFNRLTINKK